MYNVSAAKTEGDRDAPRRPSPNQADSPPVTVVAQRQPRPQATQELRFSVKMCMPFLEHARGYRITDSWNANSPWRCDFGARCLDYWCLPGPDGILRGGPACKRTKEQYHEKYRIDSSKGDVEKKSRARRALRQDLCPFVLGLCESCQIARLNAHPRASWSAQCALFKHKTW